MLWIRPLLYYLMGNTSYATDSAQHLQQSTVNVPHFVLDELRVPRRKRSDTNEMKESGSESNPTESRPSASDSVGTFKDKIVRMIHTWPKDQQVGAQRVNMEWYGRAQKIEAHLEQLASYAEDRDCATRLRTGIEQLRLHNALNHSKDRDRQKNIHSELGLLWTDREKILKNIMQQLGSLAEELQTETDKEKKKKKTEEELMSELQGECKRFNALGVFPPNMMTMRGSFDIIQRLLYFNKIDNLTNDEWKEWKETQASFWRERKMLWSTEKSLLEVDYQTADALVRHTLLDSQSYNTSHLYQYIEKPEEEDYLDAYILKIINQEGISDQYEECLWVAHVWPNSTFRTQVINGIRKDPKRDEFWDTLSDFKMIDKFCSIDQLIYNGMSVNDFHEQGPQLPDFCKVCRKDRRSYVLRLATRDKLIKIFEKKNRPRSQIDVVRQE